MSSRAAHDRDIEMMAQVVLSHIVEAALDDLGDMWENWPEIGEDDWIRIVALVGLVAVRPTEQIIQAAYSELATKKAK